MATVALSGIITPTNVVTATSTTTLTNKTLTSPTLTTPALGTPASGVVTNLTGTASININGTVGATTPSTGAFTTVSASGQISGTKNSAAQAVFNGWESVGGASADNGQIQLGVTAAYCGNLHYDAAGNTTLYIDNSYNSNSSKIKIRTKTGATAFEAITVTGDGSVAMGNGLSVTNTVGVGGATPSASGAGITFPATASDSTSANTLDDYEEGTWTPSVGGTATYTTQTGTYTKIGRMVNVQFDMTINVIGTGTTGAISGVPFSANANYHAVYVGYWSNIAITATLINGFIVGNTTLSMAGTNAAANTSTFPFAIFGSSARVIGGCTYFT